MLQGGGKQIGILVSVGLTRELGLKLCGNFGVDFCIGVQVGVPAVELGIYLVVWLGMNRDEVVETYLGEGLVL